MKISIPRILIAATSSGSGKTTITCGLINCLKRKGFSVSSFKCGPDYIDPLFHENILGVPSGNLDSFFADDDMVKYLLGKNSLSSDISVIEGVMGYYDGLGFTSKASSAEISNITKTPVILIINCKGIANSIGAILKGFTEYEKNMIEGVIFNMIPEKLYSHMSKIAIEVGLKPLGYIPYCKDIVIKSRHLGLEIPEDKNEIINNINKLSDIMFETLNIDEIVKLASSAETLNYNEIDIDSISNNNNSKPIVAVAKDKAFNFIYKDNVDILEKMGLEIRYFSPLNDEKLPDNISGLILSGGYPEVYAKELSQNKSMIESIKNALLSNMPCIAECGGFIYLHESIISEDENEYNFVGAIKGKCHKTTKLKRFGYIEAKALKNTVLCDKNEILKAHEFHYYESDNDGQDFFIQKPGNKNQWITGYGNKNQYFGFPHIFLYGNIKAAFRFAEAVRDFEL